MDMVHSSHEVVAQCCYEPGYGWWIPVVSLAVLWAFSAR